MIKTNTRTLVTSFLTLTLVALGMAGTILAFSTVTPEAATALLKSGNLRYVQGKPTPKDYVRDRVANAETQHPYAIVVACADSRLSPEILFDESLGRLFVIRVAGNVIDPVVLGSIEYAAEHLHVGLILVLGHESCGAVTAALAGGHFTPGIEALVHRIAPAVNMAKLKKLGAKETLNSAIKENVLLQCDSLMKESELVKELVHKGELRIVGGVYNLHSGAVEMFAPHASS
jgi:carbonic anhydrase